MQTFPIFDVTSASSNFEFWIYALIDYLPKPHCRICPFANICLIWNKSKIIKAQIQWQKINKLFHINQNTNCMHSTNKIIDRAYVTISVEMINRYVFLHDMYEERLYSTSIFNVTFECVVLFALFCLLESVMSSCPFSLSTMTWSTTLWHLRSSDDNKPKEMRYNI